MTTLMSRELRLRVYTFSARKQMHLVQSLCCAVDKRHCVACKAARTRIRKEPVAPIPAACQLCLKVINVRCGLTSVLDFVDMTPLGKSIFRYLQITTKMIFNTCPTWINVPATCSSVW